MNRLPFSLFATFVIAFLLALFSRHSAFALDFGVNIFTDTTDSAPGDGGCKDASNNCSLRAAIQESNASAGDDRINLSAGTYLLSLTGRNEDAAATGDLDISAGGITIVGSGTVGEPVTSFIDGNGIDRVFDLLKQSNVTLRRVIILNGDDKDAVGSDFDKSQGGGGIRAWESNLTLDTVTLQNNRSASHGGAISFTYNPFGRPKLTSLTIFNSTLLSNTATINGGGLIIGGGSTLAMSDSNVISNTARSKSTNGISRYGGGGIYVGQGYTPIGGDLLNTSAYFTKTTFTNNLASDRNNNLVSGSAWGGALHLELATVSVTQSSFTENIADGRDGGAIYNDNATLTIMNSIFDGNVAHTEGGAISANSVKFTSIDGSNFVNNRTVDSALGGGGAVSGRGQENNGFFGISNSSFQNNSTIGSGGALKIGSNSMVINSEIISNSAGANGGGIVVSKSNIDAPAIIDNVTISGNAAYVFGGGLQNGDVLFLSDSIIRNNSTITGDGGGISNYQAYALTITNTDILNNRSERSGGGLYDSHKTQGSNNIFPHTTLLSDVIIDGNQAQTDGGGVMSLSTMQIVNTTISNNSTKSSGGGILTYSAFQFASERTLFPVNLDLMNVTLSNNSAAEGGALYQNGGVTRINNTTIASNSASNARGGGGIYTDMENSGDEVNPNTITLQNTIVAQNIANPAPDCANTVLTNGNNLIGNNSGCTFSATGSDKVGTAGTPIDPLLAALANNGGPTRTRALQSGSPAINAGNAATCTTTDQRGAERISTCDIGAFEFGSIPKQEQTITFAVPADKSMGDAPFALNATASSGLAVSYNSSTPAVCTISGSIVTLVATGTCTITASQAGNGMFNPADSVVRNFQVIASSKQNQTITFPKPADKTLGDIPFALNATASSGLTVSYSSDTPTICTVDESTVTLIAVGTCTITATQAGNALFNAASSVPQGFAVNAAPSGSAQKVYLPLVRR